MAATGSPRPGATRTRSWGTTRRRAGSTCARRCRRRTRRDAMPTPTERALQATLSAVVWEAVAAGQDEVSVIRAVNLVLAQLTAAYVRDNTRTVDSVLAQVANELRSLVEAMVGTAAP